MLQFILTLADESDHEKIEDIYKKYHYYMIKCAMARFSALGRSNCLYDAEDAVQNTYMKIARNIDRIDFSRGENDVKNYCLAILSNEIYNILSEASESLELSEHFNPSELTDLADELEIRENYEKTVAAIKNLDEKYSTTLQLYFCEEMSPSEIAGLMAISSKTVYTRLARGRRLLLDSLKGDARNEKKQP